MIRGVLGLKTSHILIQTPNLKKKKIFTVFIGLYLYGYLLTIQDHYFEKSVQIIYFIPYLKAKVVESLKKTHFGDSCSDDLLKNQNGK